MNAPTRLSTLRSRAAIIATGMACFLNMYVTQALLPTLQHEFDASVTAVGLTVTATTLAVALAAPLAGSLSDRFGRKRMLLCSLAGLSAATLLAATARDLPQLLLWRTLEGLFIPGIFTSSVAYIGEEWAGGRIPAMTALYVAGSVFGGFSGRFLGGLITAWQDWQTAFFILGLFELLFLPIIAWGLPASLRFQATPNVRTSLSGFGNHLRNPRLLGTCLIGFGILFTQVATFTYINFHLTSPPFSLKLHELSFIYFVFLLGMLVTPAAGRLAGRFGQRRMMMLAMAMGSAGMLLTLPPSLPSILAGLTLSSAGVFIAQSMATSLIPAFAGRARSAAVGLYVMCYYVGGSVGGFLPGLTWPQLGWTGCVAMVLAMQALAALVAWRAWGPRAQPFVPENIPMAGAPT